MTLDRTRKNQIVGLFCLVAAPDAGAFEPNPCPTAVGRQSGPRLGGVSGRHDLPWRYGARACGATGVGRLIAALLCDMDHIKPPMNVTSVDVFSATMQVEVYPFDHGGCG